MRHRICGLWVVLAVLLGPVAAFGNQEVLQLTKDNKVWAITGKDYAGTRYSPLNQINATNVRNLKAAWTFSTGVLRGHEGNPLVIGSTMYFHTAFPNIVYALDLTKEPGTIKWKYTPQQDPEVIPIACCDVVNRGLAYGDGKLFLQQLDAHVVALDAATGKEVWKVQNGDFKKGETMTNAPIVIKDKVIVGISGGEFGVRGHVTAYNIKDGSRVWRAYSTGPDSEVLMADDFNSANPQHGRKGEDLGVKTWPGDEWQRGGGTTWGWYTYDPELNLFYYSTGNPGTWNPDQRPGDNKWSMTIFARNPDTGEAKWAYQMTPHDAWDYDGVNENILVDLTIGGRKVKALVHFDRNGFAYTLDRTNGTLLVAEPYGPVNWAKGIDKKTGRPIEDPAKRTSSKQNTKDICPAAIGFKDQQPAAFSPKTGLFYVPTNNVCMDYEGVEVKYQAGLPYVGAIVRMFPGPGGHRGAFIAWDPVKGRKVWEIKENLPAYGGVLVTGGDLAFYGTMEGWLKAVDLKTGKVVWKFRTPSGIIGNPMTYMGPDGKQYIAVLSGVGGWAGIGIAAGIGAEDPTAGLGALGAFGDVDKYTTLGGTLTVFALDQVTGAKKTQ